MVGTRGTGGNRVEIWTDTITSTYKSGTENPGVENVW